MAKWSTKYQDSLPDSAFLYVDPKTRERKLPVLNRAGNLSVSHLNNAKARLNQTIMSRAKRGRVRKEIDQLQKLALVGQ